MIRVHSSITKQISPVQLKFSLPTHSTEAVIEKLQWHALQCNQQGNEYTALLGVSCVPGVVLGVFRLLNN